MDLKSWFIFERPTNGEDSLLLLSKFELSSNYP
jgi:hypothetical protein